MGFKRKKAISLILSLVMCLTFQVKIVSAQDIQPIDKLVISADDKHHFIARKNPAHFYIESKNSAIKSFTEAQMYIISNILNINIFREAEKPNLVLLIGSNLFEGDKANLEVIKRYINNDTQAKSIASLDIWKGKCGTFYGTNKDRELNFSLTLIDDSISDELIKQCAITSTFISFGVLGSYSLQNNRSLLEIGFASAKAVGYCMEKNSQEVECAKQIYMKITDNKSSIIRE